MKNKLLIVTILALSVMIILLGSTLPTQEEEETEIIDTDHSDLVQEEPEEDEPETQVRHEVRQDLERVTEPIEKIDGRTTEREMLE